MGRILNLPQISSKILNLAKNLSKYIINFSLNFAFKGEKMSEEQNQEPSQNTQNYLICPHCGKDDIKYGVRVCSGCQAEISYQRPWLLKMLIGIAFIYMAFRYYNFWRLVALC